MKPNTEVSHNFAYRLQNRAGEKGEEKKGKKKKKGLTESFTVYYKTPVKARICKH